MGIQSSPKLENVPNSKQWPQILAVLSACICSVSIGANFGWTSPYFRQMLSPDFPIPLTSEELSYVAVSPLFGYFVGIPTASYLVNKIGRKKSLLLIAIPQLAAWITLGLSNSLITYCVARAISGIPESSAFALMPMYMGEVCEPKVRGILGTYFTLSMITGNFAVNLLGDYTTVSEGSFIFAFVPILFAMVFIWMPESPYYLIGKGRIEDARKSLKWLRKLDNVEPELTQLIEDVKVQTTGLSKNKFKELFCNPINFKTFLILVGLRCGQQMSGISAFGIYCQKLFADAGTNISPTASALVLSGIQIVMIFIGSLVVDKLGRRPLYMGSSIMTCFVLSILSAYFYLRQYHGITLNWLPLAGMIIYIVVMSIGLAVVPNLMMSELLSTSIKAEALGVNNLIFGFVYTGSAKLFQVLQDNAGLYAPFLLYAVCCLFAFVFALKYVPETKGRTLEEIQQELRRKKSSSKQNIVDVVC